MPDEWEVAHGLDPDDPDDYLADPDGDGYPNIEEYLNGTDPNAPEPEVALDAETFRAIQQAAKDRCAEAASAFAARRDAENRQRDADRQAAINAMDIRIEPRGGDIQRVHLGAAAHFDLVPIPAGSFLMGSPSEEGGAPNERPQQPVTISRDFYLGATAITNAQFVAIMGPTERRTREGEENHPAHEVTWFEVVEFCRLIGEKTGQSFRRPPKRNGVRLPRFTSTAFYTGDTITSDQANFDAQAATRFNPMAPTTQAGRCRPVPAQPLGPLRHAREPGGILPRQRRAEIHNEPVTDPQGPPGDGKVLRGGQAKARPNSSAPPPATATPPASATASAWSWKATRTRHP